MAEVKWIKIVTDVFDDEKIKLIEGMPEADAIIVIWFKVLCMAGKQNNGGVLMMNDRIAYTDEMLAMIFRRPLPTVRLALKTFEDFGMIEIVNNAITIPNWEKHQSLDKLAEAKEKNRLRVAAHRERQKALASGNDYGNVTPVTSNDADIDKDIDIEKDKEKEKDIDSGKRKRFAAPTVDEVKAYCLERKNNVDAQKFIDYYISNGWMVGKNKMKDWKAAVRTWERNGFGNNNKTYGASGIAVDQSAPDDLAGIF